MTVRRLHFEGSIPAERLPQRRNNRAARTLIAAAVLAGLAGAFSGFTVSPSALDFGGQRVGFGETLKPVEIINRSSSELHPQMGVEGKSSSDFLYEKSLCATIPAGGSCRLPVRFAPREPGEKLASLMVSLGTQKPFIIALRGEAIPPAVTLSPGQLDFHNVVVRDSSAADVSITGEGWFHVHAVSLNGPGQSQFKTALRSCRQQSYAPRECIVTATFAPQSEGLFTATLVINDDGLGSPHRVTLRGTGVSPPISPKRPVIVPPPVTTPPPLPSPQLAIRIEPALLDFSQKPRSSQRVRISNEGNAPLRVNDIKILGADADRFQVDKHACPEISRGDDCFIAVSYHSKFWGAGKASYTAELTVEHNAANIASPQSVALRWQAPEPAPQAHLDLKPESLSFSGTAALGKPVSLPAQTITIHNSGPGEVRNLNVRLGLLGGGENKFFAHQSNCASMAVDSTCEIKVTFSATEARKYKETLYIVDGFFNVLASIPLEASLASPPDDRRHYSGRDAPPGPGFE